MIKYNVWFMLVVLFMSGCAGKVKMTPEVKAKLTSLSLSDEVIIPDEFSVNTRKDMTVALAAGLIPNLVFKSNSFTENHILSMGIYFLNMLDKSDEKKFINLMQKHDINFADILEKAYLNALQKKPYYAQKLVTKSSDATFRISVKGYGLFVGPLFFLDSYRLGTAVSIELVDKKGDVLWRDNDTFNVPFFNEIESLVKPYDAYAKHPEVLRKDLNYLAKHIAKTLVGRLP